MKKFKRAAVYNLTRLLLFFFNIIPRRTAVFIGGWLGLAAWMLYSRDRFRILRHLSLVYKDRLSLKEKNIISRNFFINSGKNLADVIRFRKHYRTEIKPLVTVEGLEYFDRAYKAGRGLFGITGHIGNFELLAVHLADLGYKIAVIGREMYDNRLDKLLVDNREAMGLTNIPTTDSPRKLLSWLKDGGAVGVLIDTDSFRVRGMFIPTFGRLSNTPVGQTIIGLKTGAAFLPMFCLRTVDNRYKIIIKPPIDCIPRDTSEEQVYLVTLKCTKALEEIINLFPDQWIWLHNRWRTRP
ncbi:MAG: lysophospholipid acyltransferase family protein [candidate division Zixibacteria bacterium]|nr:lysophospholipid acyltransferase family protein [candidate division Zixibacteria bacterium]